MLEKADLGVSYAAYRDAVRQAVDAGRTTGDHQTPALAEYTVLNQARMDRLDKTVRLDPDLREALEQV
ncbi:MAG: thioredoxin family protein, partial [Flavobacteriales bacterium]|nr:thioredoxin family protein [Flavobacteriales bacterium]